MVSVYLAVFSQALLATRRLSFFPKKQMRHSVALSLILLLANVANTYACETSAQAAFRVLKVEVAEPQRLWLLLELHQPAAQPTLSVPNATVWRWVRLDGVHVPSGSTTRWLTRETVKSIELFAARALRDAEDNQTIDRRNPQALFWENLWINRYDDGVGILRNRQCESMQSHLVGAGLAMVSPSQALDSDHLERQQKTHKRLLALLALEEEARRARRGLWRSALGTVRSALDDTWWEAGRFTLVEGQPLAFTIVRGVGYLNFGTDWRRDFTVRLDASTAKTNPQLRTYLKGLVDKHVRVRGIVIWRNGPMIHLRNQLQIEDLDTALNE